MLGHLVAFGGGGGGSGSGLTIGTFDSQTPSADGLVIDTGVLFAQSASPTVPGMVNTSTQAFAGEKTFNDLLIGAASLRLGPADAASPTAQSITIQSVAAGTSNTAGANFTFKASQGTGTGVGGSIILQVAPAGGTGSSQNALSTALTIDSTRLATFAGAVTVSGVLTATLAPVFSALTASNMPYLNASKVLTASAVAVDNTTLALTISPTGSPSNGVQVSGASATTYTNLFHVTGTLPASGSRRGLTVDMTAASGTGGGYGIRCTIPADGTTSGWHRLYYAETNAIISSKTFDPINGVAGNTLFSGAGNTGGNTSGGVVGSAIILNGGNRS